MPVTLVTAPHPSREWEGASASDAKSLLKMSCGEHHQHSNVVKDSFSFSPGLFEDFHISPSENGLVWSVFSAYSYNHNLILRPQDVWFAILIQLNFFLKAHDEDLWSPFVANGAKEKIELLGGGDNSSTFSANFDAMAVAMTNLVQKHFKDPDIQQWIMPGFSTTTVTDTVVAAVLMMGDTTTQQDFYYKITRRGGIPAVALLGDKADWELLVKKIDKLAQFGDEPARFGQLLRPILNHFVLSFEDPDSPEVLSFWGQCAREEYMGSSDLADLCGWVTAFCFWDECGQMLCREQIRPVLSSGFEKHNTAFGLKDVLSRRLGMDCLSPVCASLPLTVDDHGRVYEAIILAGLIGIQARSIDTIFGQDISCHEGMIDDCPSRNPQDHRVDFIQPLPGWWMYTEPEISDDE